MNHAEAVSTGAAERYLLGQLSSSESEEFEQHFFDCSECTKDLQRGAILEETARSIFLDERLGAEAKAAAAQTSRWWRWSWAAALPAFASILLGLIAGYQAWVVIPGLRNQLQETVSPQPMVSYILHPASRGESHALEIPLGARFYAIDIDPAWEGSFAAYLCSIVDESGAGRFAVRVPAPSPGNPLEILMARSILPSGRYIVIVRGAAENGKPETELARYALIVKLH